MIGVKYEEHFLNKNHLINNLNEAFHQQREGALIIITCHQLAQLQQRISGGMSALGEAVKQNIRESDQLLSCCDNMFVVVLSSIQTAEEVKVVTERLIAILLSFEIDLLELGLELRTALYPADGRSGEELYLQAEIPGYIKA
ncbi:hypothetical protein LC040_10810 [Bacillus tianshenii]|nr:hypothetical protein LC040_10810 [Bacillus tianshenii]